LRGNGEKDLKAYLPDLLGSPRIITTYSLATLEKITKPTILQFQKTHN